MHNNVRNEFQLSAIIIELYDDVSLNWKMFQAIQLRTYISDCYAKYSFSIRHIYFSSLIYIVYFTKILHRGKERFFENRFVFNM